MNTTIKQLIEKIVSLIYDIDNNTRLVVYKDDISNEVYNVVDISLRRVYNGKVISDHEYVNLTANEQCKTIRAVVIDTF